MSNQLPYETFRTAISTLLTEAGVPHTAEDRSRFIGVTSSLNGHRVWIAREKTADGVFLVHTSIDLPFGEKPSDNGAMRTYVRMDLEDVKQHIVPRMADQADRLPAARRKTVARPSSVPKAPKAAALNMLSGLEAE